MGAVAMDKPVFTKDQLVRATEIARQFSDVRKKAKIAPLGILDRSGLTSVLMNYEHYEQMYLYIQELEEKVLEAEISERAAELKMHPTSAVPWRKVRRTSTE